MSLLHAAIEVWCYGMAGLSVILALLEIAAYVLDVPPRPAIVWYDRVVKYLGQAILCVLVIALLEGWQP